MKPRRYGARGTIPVQQQAGLLDDVTLLDYMGMVSPMLPAALLGDPFSPTEAMAGEEQELKKFRDAQSYQAPSIRKSKKTSTKITGSKYTPPKDAFLNLSNMSEIPDVPQKVFDRMEPTKKAIETFEKYATRSTMDRMNQAVDKGLSMGGLEWYNLNPLKQAFIDELGDEEGVKMFNNYLDISAPMSIQSTLPAQLKRGQYFYNRFVDDPATAFDVGNPELKGTGYGTPMLGGMKINALKNLEGVRNVKEGQKIPTYTENLKGNYMPITSDIHNVRLFTGGDIKDSAPPNAYRIIEQPQQIEATRRGIAPAQYQAAAWLGAGADTNLKTQPVPFMEVYDQMLQDSARKQGVSPKELLKNLIRGKGSLLAIPAAALGTLASMYDSEDGLLD